jgi:hypothetical protein
MSKKSSPLKPLGPMNQNLVGSIYGRSSIKILISSRSVNKQFWFIGPSGFRGEDFLDIDQSEIRIAGGSHIC